MKALIVYHTKTGHTEQAALDVARGLESCGVECAACAAANAKAAADISEYEILAVGSPTYGNRRYRLPARQVSDFLDSLSSGKLEGKTCGVFTVNAGWGGEKLAGAMERALEVLGGHVVGKSPVVKAGAPLSLWKGPDASPSDVSKCEEFGKKLARVANG
ncbi:MAG: flavodoxin domain-containing protein [Actinobacteria bacterium]|nr:flavodoxin domain-containing protein [Actinomycetota bacterium]MCG2795803.1 flavodoxin domain-containing protein [Actinomycetes bacterium]MBU4240779.1 flavodoxin domain-containing protein [Actinomycetota bacterium]MBU4301924.1 flavodoxin domain-containing protein [Actinomycetota bacterium]MBU4386316.1 flavodoxin domain-containing protein [Actinomycetota bacterium]